MRTSAPARSKPLRSRGATLCDHPGRRDRCREADRRVDQQHPPPAGLLRDEPAKERAGGASGAVHRSPEGDRAVALGPGGERGGDDRQRRGRHRGAAEALDRTRQDQHPTRGRESAAQGRQPEQQQRGDECPTLPQDVRGTSGEHQEAREHDRVSVDDPLQVRRGEAQALLNRRQRDVDDREIEDHHELRDAADAEQEALARELAFLGRLGRRVATGCADADAHCPAPRAQHVASPQQGAGTDSEVDRPDFTAVSTRRRLST